VVLLQQDRLRERDRGLELAAQVVQPRKSQTIVRVVRQKAHLIVNGVCKLGRGRVGSGFLRARLKVPQFARDKYTPV
jgi:hypothetical protein